MNLKVKETPLTISLTISTVCILAGVHIIRSQKLDRVDQSESFFDSSLKTRSASSELDRPVNLVLPTERRLRLVGTERPI